MQTVALALAHDCADVWNLTGIPHQLNDIGNHYIVQKLKALIEEGNKLKKIPKNRRSDNTYTNFDILFDIASCQHKGDSGDIVCDCPKDKKVNADWVGFLKDQRQGRILFIGQIDKIDKKGG